MKAKVASLKAEDAVKIQLMRPGMWVDIQADTPTATKRARTDLIGIDQQKNVFIVRMPDESKYGNLRDAIYATNDVIMRLILEDETGDVVAFKSVIRSVMAQPFNYVVVDFPELMQSQSLRSEDRSRITLPVQVSIDGVEGESFSGHIVDISANGCRLAVPAEQKMAVMKNRQSIAMRVKQADNKMVTLRGVVKNLKQAPLQHFYGVKFDEENQDALKAIWLPLALKS
ncbi:flagellar brake protein [Alteromonas sediminis]|uniref:Flagellar brake protein n=1 Tax=Alteromonas sediminis TaxID=2259342 RepID=A0A3N5Y3C2_9ALTE|nr:PilZ domain-containing protein [Alteromonas sediminis]RPJ68392.1 flagellar brake protein [Alteromonas sediminis]